MEAKQMTPEDAALITRKYELEVPASVAAATDPDASFKQALAGEGKYRKRVTFYGKNAETGVEELRLLDLARDLAVVNTGSNLSIEDFIRGAALQVAAQLVIREKQAQEADAQKAAALEEAKKQAQEKQFEGVENGAELQTETTTAEAGTAGDSLTPEST